MIPSLATLLASLFPAHSGQARRRALAAGFVATALVIAVLIGISLYSMSEIRASLDRLGNLLQSKSEAVATMRENLYLRLVSSRDMLVMRDSFEIDAEAQRFHVYGERIGYAYLRFLELTEDPGDRALAEEFITEARRGMPLLRSAINELLAGKRPEEIVPLLNEAFETQKLALEVLRRLQERVRDQSLSQTGDAVARYQRTRVLIIVLTVAALLLVLSIAIVVTRLITLHTRELEQQHRRYKTLFEANRDAVLIVQDGRIVEGNQRALDWFADPECGGLAGLALDALSAGDETAGRVEPVLRRMGERGGGAFEWTFRGRDGQPFFGEVSLTPLPSPTGNQLQLMIRDVTARTLALRQMSHDASHDPMTGLVNRREFERRVSQAIEDARALGNRHSLCFMDLDKFKDVNDLAGHAAGDELLRQVAQLFKSRIRTADLVARLGGDEFGLLLENCSGDQATAIVHGLIDGVEALRFQAAGNTFRVGVSVGLVEIGRDSPGFDAALRLADQACYDAKREGSRLRIRRDGAAALPS